MLVMDNLNTHGIASLYEAFTPDVALALSARLEIHYTPKHGSWLNMAETELSVLSRQCLDRRIDDRNLMAREIATWQADRNAAVARINWQFKTDDARIKLKRLYPSFEVLQGTSGTLSPSHRLVKSRRRVGSWCRLFPLASSFGRQLPVRQSSLPVPRPAGPSQRRTFSRRPRRLFRSSRGRGHRGESRRRETVRSRLREPRSGRPR